MMNVPTPIILNEIDELLDRYQVNVMVYEPRLDAAWVDLFWDNPAWAFESGDDDIIVFTRCPELAFDR